MVSAALSERGPQAPAEDVPGLVLLVDDEPLMLAAAKATLQHLGYSVVTAENGAVAVEVAKASPEDIDLVLLDMIMPELGGRATFEALRGAGCQARILVSSGYSQDGEVAELLDRGVDAFIGKPFDGATLAHKVRQVLDSGAPA